MKTLHLSIIIVVTLTILISSHTVFAFATDIVVQTASFNGKQGTYAIPYNMTNGKLVASLLDLPAKEFIFTINATGDDKLTVELPRKIIDSTRDDKDKPYLVFVGSSETATNRIKAHEIENNNERRTLAIDFAKSDNQIGIVGTYFIENNSTSSGWNPFGAFTPLQQYKKGFDAQDIVCKQDLQLVIKSEDETPACVKPQMAQKLVERGWGTLVSSVAQQTPTQQNTQYTPSEVKDKIPNVYELSIKFISSDKGFFTGGVAPVGKDSTTAKTPSHGLLYSAKKDVTIHKLFLCESTDCIDSGGSGAFVYSNMPDPGFLSFYDLNKVSWKKGDKIHIWAKVSEGIYDSSKQDLPKTNWIDLGITTIEPCETYGFWCYPK